MPRIAPVATTSSGWSMTVGAMPVPLCRLVATSGMRDAPPTRYTPAMRSTGTAAARMTPWVSRTALPRSGSVSASSSSRVTWVSMSNIGTSRSTRLSRERRSLAARTSSTKVRWWRRCAVSRGLSSCAQRSSPSYWPPMWSTTARSMSTPPSVSDPSTASTSKPVSAATTTDTSKVPPPKSYTTIVVPPVIAVPDRRAK